MLLLSIVAITVVDARKTYIVKERIEAGVIKVASPRVMAYDCQWCFFKDANNDFCILGDLNWKLDMKTEKYNQEDLVLTIPGHYRHTFIYQTTQSGAWMTQFNLKKLYYNTITYNMVEFTAGLKFEMYYWYADQAVCLDMAVFIKPTDFNIVSATKLEQCSRVLIKCIDNWDSWTNPD